MQDFEGLILIKEVLLGLGFGGRLLLGLTFAAKESVLQSDVTVEDASQHGRVRVQILLG